MLVAVGWGKCRMLRRQDRGEDEEGIKADSQMSWLEPLGEWWYGDSPGPGLKERWPCESLQGPQPSVLGDCTQV